jgi:hypothetical protein
MNSGEIYERAPAATTADDAAPRVHSVTRSKAGRESARTHGAHVVSKPHQYREMNKLSFSATFAMIISTASACTEIQLRSPTGATPLTHPSLRLLQPAGRA